MGTRAMHAHLCSSFCGVAARERWPLTDVWLLGWDGAGSIKLEGDMGYVGDYLFKSLLYVVVFTPSKPDGNGYIRGWITQDANSGNELCRCVWRLV